MQTHATADKRPSATHHATAANPIIRDTRNDLLLRQELRRELLELIHTLASRSSQFLMQFPEINSLAALVRTRLHTPMTQRRESLLRLSHASHCKLKINCKPKSSLSIKNWLFRYSLEFSVWKLKNVSSSLWTRSRTSRACLVFNDETVYVCNFLLQWTARGSCLVRVMINYISMLRSLRRRNSTFYIHDVKLYLLNDVKLFLIINDGGYLFLINDGD